MTTTPSQSPPPRTLNTKRSTRDLMPFGGNTIIKSEFGSSVGKIGDDQQKPATASRRLMNVREASIVHRCVSHNEFTNLSLSLSASLEPFSLFFPGFEDSAKSALRSIANSHALLRAKVVVGPPESTNSSKKDTLQFEQLPASVQVPIRTAEGLLRVIAEQELSSPINIVSGPLMRVVIVTPIPSFESPVIRTVDVIFTFARAAFEPTSAFEVVKQWVQLVYGPVTNSGSESKALRHQDLSEGDIRELTPSACSVDSTSIVSKVSNMLLPVPTSWMSFVAASNTSTSSSSTTTNTPSSLKVNINTTSNTSTIATSTSPAARPADNETNTTTSPTNNTNDSRRVSSASILSRSPPPSRCVSPSPSLASFTTSTTLVNTRPSSALSIRTPNHNNSVATSPNNASISGLFPSLSSHSLSPSHPIANTLHGISPSSYFNHELETDPLGSRYPNGTRLLMIRLSIEETNDIINRAESLQVSLEGLIAGALSVAVAPFVKSSGGCIGGGGMNGRSKTVGGVGGTSISGNGMKGGEPVSVSMIGCVSVDGRNGLNIKSDVDGAFDLDVKIAHERGVRVVGKPGLELFHQVVLESRGAFGQVKEALGAFEVVNEMAVVPAVSGGSVPAVTLSAGEDVDGDVKGEKVDSESDGTDTETVTVDNGIKNEEGSLQRRKQVAEAFQRWYATTIQNQTVPTQSELEKSQERVIALADRVAGVVAGITDSTTTTANGSTAASSSWMTLAANAAAAAVKKALLPAPTSVPTYQVSFSGPKSWTDRVVGGGGANGFNGDRWRVGEDEDDDDDRSIHDDDENSIYNYVSNVFMMETQSPSRFPEYDIKETISVHALMLDGVMTLTLGFVRGGYDVRDVVKIESRLLTGLIGNRKWVQQKIAAA
ncbi:hypothetical protein HDU76_012073 [Blyttiomyces sp. JEL0837]|nr:hypothetical protein HDU76_012073 [Blyttiomyces sp. JEL0837]